jgi:hypothetical protein
MGKQAAHSRDEYQATTTAVPGEYSSLRFQALQTSRLNTVFLIPIIIACASLGACNQAPGTDSTPLITPNPASNPAKEAQAEAVRRYPDLAVKGSLFNQTFVAAYEREKSTNPGALTTSDWPLTLARQTADQLQANALPSAPATNGQTDWFNLRLNEAQHAMDKRKSH